MKTTLILSIFLLLTSCELADKSIDTSNNQIEKAKEVAEKEKNSTEKVQKDNLQTKEKKETMAKTEKIQKAGLQEGDLVATMKTTNGTIKIKLFNNIVPNTVNNFAGLAQD
jgi:uncharacterized membrane protein